MAGCVLIGEHSITVEYGTDPGETNMLIKSSDVEVNFYLDDDGSLKVTFMSDLTIGADLIGVIPAPKDGG